MYLVVLSVGVPVNGKTNFSHGCYAKDAFDRDIRHVGAALAVDCFSTRLDELR